VGGIVEVIYDVVVFVVGGDALVLVVVVCCFLVDFRVCEQLCSRVWCWVLELFDDDVVCDVVFEVYGDLCCFGGSI